MCRQHNPRKIDKCMKHLVAFINQHTSYKTYGCCCGHGKYPMTIIIGLNVKDKNIEPIRLELMSNLLIDRKKRFYIKDKQGYYYIPEVINNGL